MQKFYKIFFYILYFQNILSIFFYFAKKLAILAACFYRGAPLFDGSVFFISDFHNPNYLEIKKNLISKLLAPCSNISQLETFKLPEVLSFSDILKILNSNWILLQPPRNLRRESCRSKAGSRVSGLGGRQGLSVCLIMPWRTQ